MPLVLYNTLTRKLEEFTPLVEGAASMYTCGPTVYNFFHIGNARSFVMSDVIRRYLEYRGYDVNFVMNITDVDDRIIKQAIDEGIDASAVAGKYTDAFLEDIARLGIRPATANPRATDNIEGIVSHIERLIAAGAAYTVEGDVYFRVSAFPAYGKLSGKRLEDLQAGARVDADSRKEQPGDFALWKTAKPGEPSWPSPWGAGRPGWHIECSVMSQKYLGDSFDIHAGGNDLIFPHHENEIAQSEALTHTPLARTWLHFGFLNIDNEKMSKSLGNFFTARDILSMYSAETLRFFYLQTHYRSPLNFSDDGLDAAAKGLQKLQGLYDQLLTAPDGEGIFDVGPWEQRFIAAVDQDMNTPAGFGVLFECARDANGLLRSDVGMTANAKAALRDFLRRSALGVFGVLHETETARADSSQIGALMDLLIAVRAKARADKQWGLSDFIRDGLKDIGLALEDGKAGTTWKRADNA
ncbi:MAG: cysteine--tRNA ligase [Ignavibacteria bacterium]|nr:cysteine--tRNA ligase [Ignavibacteria bacterium]